MSLLADLLAAESAVWDALARGDAAADAALLAPGFLGVYPTGLAGRTEHVAQLAKGASVAEWSITGARVLDLAPGLALLAYRAEFRRTGSAKPEAMYVSSIWQRLGNGWVNLFSQDTPEGAVVP